MASICALVNVAKQRLRETNGSEMAQHWNTLLSSDSDTESMIRQDFRNPSSFLYVLFSKTFESIHSAKLDNEKIMFLSKLVVRVLSEYYDPSLYSSIWLRLFEFPSSQDLIFSILKESRQFEADFKDFLKSSDRHQSFTESILKRLISLEPRVIKRALLASGKYLHVLLQILVNDPSLENLNIIIQSLDNRDYFLAIPDYFNPQPFAEALGGSLRKVNGDFDEYFETLCRVYIGYLAIFPVKIDVSIVKFIKNPFLMTCWLLVAWQRLENPLIFNEKLLKSLNSKDSPESIRIDVCANLLVKDYSRVVFTVNEYIGINFEIPAAVLDHARTMVSLGNFLKSCLKLAETGSEREQDMVFSVLLKAENLHNFSISNWFLDFIESNSLKSTSDLLFSLIFKVLQDPQFNTTRLVFHLQYSTKPNKSLLAALYCWLSLEKVKIETVYKMNVPVKYLLSLAKHSNWVSTSAYGFLLNNLLLNFPFMFIHYNDLFIDYSNELKQWKLYQKCGLQPKFPRIEPIDCDFHYRKLVIKDIEKESVKFDRMYYIDPIGCSIEIMNWIGSKTLNWTDFEFKDYLKRPLLIFNCKIDMLDLSKFEYKLFSQAIQVLVEMNASWLQLNFPKDTATKMTKITRNASIHLIFSILIEKLKVENYEMSKCYWLFLYINDCFLNIPDLMKSVHFEGYPFQLIDLLVANVPAMSKIDFLPQLLNSNQLLFANCLVCSLVKQYEKDYFIDLMLEFTMKLIVSGFCKQGKQNDELLGFVSRALASVDRLKSMNLLQLNIK